MAVLIKNVTTYKQLRPVALEYRKAADRAKFQREHEKLPDLYALKAKCKRLAEEKERLYKQYGETKKQMQEYYAFRALKRPVFRGLSGMVAGVVG